MGQDMNKQTAPRPAKNPGGRVPRGMKPTVENPGKVLKRLFSYVMQYYKFHVIVVVICIFLSVICNAQGTMFMQSLIDEYITPLLGSKNPDFSGLASAIGRVAAFYALGVVASYLHARLMVNVTQGTLRNIRNEVFVHMEGLPIKYFDTHSHGDIMSVYTNDIDTLRQVISQSAPQLLNSSVTIITVLICMIRLSVPLTIVTLLMVVVMMVVTAKVGGQSGKYFMKQQQDMLLLHNML